MHNFSKVLAVLFFAGAAMLPAQAAVPHDAPQERLKVALNEMVREVRQAEAASDKRAVMERFLEKAERNARLAGYLTFSDPEKSEALNALQSKFSGYQAELQGLEGHDRVADGDLNAFAGFVQQDLEQAATSGGIYLSTGAVIIILLILILIL